MAGADLAQLNFMRTICKVRFDDGHVEMIDQATLEVARALESAAKDPLLGPTVKMMVTHLMFSEAARKAAAQVPSP